MVEFVLGESAKRHDRDVQASIADAIRSSDLFVAIWSANYATSEWCIEELDLAMSRNRSPGPWIGGNARLGVVLSVQPRFQM
ncbi:MAG: hypothetical protein A3K18_00495 [Lentisphaerae bacterium RIFOXYA12_64_32]|nr:MAG: hypothetical protein A3K18_00495 [Lentisphaerae bacterium RIFOXYA12_64_32]